MGRGVSVKIRPDFYYKEKTQMFQKLNIRKKMVFVGKDATLFNIFV